MHWIIFLISTILIIASGVRLTKYADLLSDRLQLGKLWLGIVLLGFVTSLPEAITSFISVGYLGAGDLALGNIFGSNIFNPILVVLMDMVYQKGSVTNVIKPLKSHQISVFYIVVMTFLILYDMLFLAHGRGILIGRLSLGVLAVSLIYIIGMRHLGVANKQEHLEDPLEAYELDLHQGLGRIWANIIGSAAVVVFASFWLTRAAETIAHTTGLGETFVGSFLLALVTSLPEMVVTYSAIKIGVFDLALGNIFGSNMTNLFILSLCPLFYTGGVLFANVSLTHVITAVLSVLICYGLWLGIQIKNKKTWCKIGVDAWVLAGVFMVGMVLVYSLK
ncbi:MAG: sodium:calcium antiporter [Candidatus Omnitrophica bacterium]|nr:sodium:calcium antiporter [Candidatus Omnitrophota bacterium]